MARPTALDVSSPEVTAIDLKRLLLRLEQKLLTPDSSPLLLHSSYERQKTRFNLQHARTLLLRLERIPKTQKLPSRKLAAQSTLLEQRALINRLTDRLNELDLQDDGAYTPPSDQEDVLVTYFPEYTRPALDITSDRQKEETSTILESSSSALRNRFNPSDKDTAAKTTAFTHPSTSPIANILENNTSEQLSLTSSLLLKSQQLKQAQLAIASDVEADKEVTSRAVEGLDRNVGGMESAGKRMGMLRRMTEGKGWWGRMLMYAWIIGLWILAILVVFVMPKLR